jgi:hypothetical protein
MLIGEEPNRQPLLGGKRKKETSFVWRTIFALDDGLRRNPRRWERERRERERQ